MNLKEKLAALYKEARALADKNDKDGLTDAEEARWAELKGEIAETRTAFEAQEARSREAAEFRSGDREYNQSAGQRASAAPVQESRDQAIANDRAYMQSIGRRFLESEQLKEFRDRRGSKGESSPVKIGSFYHGQMTVEHRAGMSPEEMRTLVYTGALPTNFVPNTRIPTPFMNMIAQTNVRDAFLNGPTDSELIEFYRELLFTNNAAFVAEATSFSATTLGGSGVKPESALTLERDTATVQTLAHWIPVTDRTLQDSPQMQALIEGRLIDGLKLKEDDALLNGSGSGANIKGLLNVTGVQALDGTHFASYPTENAGAANENYERILRARRYVRVTGRAVPSFVMLSPTDYEKFLTKADANKQYFAGSPFGAGPGMGSLWGLRVIETEALAAGSAVVGDGRMAAVWDRMDAMVKVGLINDQFILNMQTILAEERLAFAVYRPAAFAVVTLA